jgi:site-specific recombinase XerD
VTEIAVSPAAVPAGWGEYADSLAGALSMATAGWLAAQESEHTRTAYRRDLMGLGPDWQPAPVKAPAWLPWCKGNGIDPLTARRSHIDAWGRELEQAGFAAKTRARKLSVLSSWYAYLISEELTERNPARDAKKPRLDGNYSPTIALSEDEIDRFLDAAAAGGARTLALMSLLYFGGFRVGSVLNANIGDLGWASYGKRGLLLHLKGGKTSREPLEKICVRAVDAYLATRPGAAQDEPLLITSTGARLDEPYVWRLVRRLCRQASIGAWEQANPHMLRACHIVHARTAGVALEVIQQSVHHAYGSTTLGYDRLLEERQERSGTVLAERRERYEAARSTS